ncbi:MAG: C40 family peptidase [Tepidimonas sp.]|uniref:C40 family peptidase n=1 Tax=Tepidimonas sp. TaxID=2002775 RepID=UPI00259D7EB8|nr:C40 family peptidase [Tepidimonas sp.]MDM7456358.1 C40 family peptidase [Tepidimonas sp.]
MDLLTARGVLGDGAEPVWPALSGDAQSRRSAALVYAMAYVGVPYQRGGTAFDQGVDCSGFVQITYRESAGILLPRRAAQQAQVTLPIDVQALAPGDLVFFDTQGEPFSHVGIYIGQGRFIHAPRSGARVRMEHMESRYWRDRFSGARRVIGDGSG